VVRPTPKEVLFSASLAFAFGMLLVAVGVGVVPEGTFQLYAPLWVITACGLVALLMGIAVLQLVVHTPWLHRIQPGLAVVALMAAITNWVAFGAGERRFSSSIQLPFWSGEWTSSELMGRLIFGVSAVLLDALALAMIFRGIREWTRSRGQGRLSE
jgi:hypothetical protein